MTTRLRFAVPGLTWLPPVLRRRAYWRVVGRFALFGPLIGGLPYAWLMVTVPFVYAFGLVPAVLAGALYAAWWLAPGARVPGRGWRAALGALCGAAGCAAVALAWEPARPAETFLFLALHGVPAGLVMALITPAPQGEPQIGAGSVSRGALSGPRSASQPGTASAGMGRAIT